MYVLFPGPEADDLAAVADTEEHVAALTRAAARRAPAFACCGNATAQGQPPGEAEDGRPCAQLAAQVAPHAGHEPGGHVRSQLHLGQEPEHTHRRLQEQGPCGASRRGEEMHPCSASVTQHGAASNKTTGAQVAADTGGTGQVPQRRCSGRSSCDEAVRPAAQAPGIDPSVIAMPGSSGSPASGPPCLDGIANGFATLSVRGSSAGPQESAGVQALESGAPSPSLPPGNRDLDLQPAHNYDGRSHDAGYAGGAASSCASTAAAAANPAVAVTGATGLSHAAAPACPPPAYLLLVIDGTWKQAKEMYKAVAPRCLPPSGCGRQVALKPSDVLPQSMRPDTQAAALGQGPRTGATSAPQRGSDADASTETEAERERAATPNGDGAVGSAAAHLPSGDDAGVAAAEEGNPGEYDPDMPCLIRKEPVAGYVTTYEAAARALGLLERDPALAPTLLAPLRLLTRLQAAFSPSICSRMRAEPEPPKRRT